MSLPLLVPEDQVQVFNFYRDGAIYRAMSYRNQIYKLVDVLPIASRQRVYDLGCQYGAQGDDVVITLAEAEQCYRLWVNVQSTHAVEPVCQLPGETRSELKRFPVCGSVRGSRVAATSASAA